MTRIFTINGAVTTFIEVYAFNPEEPKAGLQNAIYVSQESESFPEKYEGVVFDTYLPETLYDAELFLINEFIDTTTETLNSVVVR